jgi:serine/threonine protein kinase
MEVVARISETPGQEEKAQEEYRRLAAVADPHYNCLLRPLEAKRLPSRNQERESSLMACIYESPGPNDLLKYVDAGAPWYREVPDVDESDEDQDNNKDEDGDDADSLGRNGDEPMPLSTFLDFAIGAAECIKILHSQQIVHGEIRADSFHFSQETGRVKLIHLGAGLRRYHSDLTNATWSALANQDGATSRISYMSPEQTGRTPIQPDSRADIYSLGILLWSALVQETPFGGRSPMEIIRAVLGEELPLVSSLRPDVPDLIARVIAKATAKNVSERYHSVSGLQHDLVELRRLVAAEELEDEDNEEEPARAAEMDNWKIGSKDVSPFFTLPRIMVGRTQERNAIVEILDRTYQMYQGKGLQLSSLPEGQFATFDALALPADTPGEEEGHNAMDGFSNLLAGTAGGVRRSYPANTARMRSPGDSRYGSFESIESPPGQSDAKTADKRLSTPSVDSASVEGSSRSSDSAGRTAAHRMMVPKGRCELITIEGGAGLGKTRLITSVQIEARQRGFFASSRFDPAGKERLRPVLQLFSSLFEQAFSENTIEPSFLPMLRNHIGSAWNTLHKVLGLPKFLLGSGPDLPDQASKRHTPAIPSSSRHTGTPSSQEFLRTGSSTKSLPLVRTLLDILRAFSRYKPLCLCLDDVHFADEESLELVAQIISARIRMVVILAYRPEKASSEMASHILDLCANEGSFPNLCPFLLQVCCN